MGSKKGSVDSEVTDSRPNQIEGQLQRQKKTSVVPNTKISKVSKKRRDAKRERRNMELWILRDRKL